MLVQIKHRFTGSVIFECECSLKTEPLRIGFAVKAAISAGKSLAGASLADANLAVAYLAGANLAGAKNIPESTPVIGTVTLAEFRSEIVPQLLTAGGKTVAEIVNGGSWECHDWSNCPMHAALGIDDASKAPIIIRPLVEKFVELYDAGLIPCPVVETEGGA